MRTASWRAGASPASQSSRVASASSSDRVTSSSGTLLLLPAGHTEGVDQLIEVAIDDVAQVVDREIDAVVGDPALRKVVGSNLGRSVAVAHHGSSIARARGLLLRDHPVEQSGSKHFHRLELVLKLRLLILLAHHDAGGKVGDPHRAVGGIHALAARAG